MKQSEIFRENAENCMKLAETAVTPASYNRFKRMEAAWLALADEQDWLDGHIPSKGRAQPIGHQPPSLSAS